MKQISDLFRPLIGQLFWCVRRGHGSFLTMEFGLPHLSVREPISASSTSSERVRKNLNRRRVFVVGDWHFWIKYGEWTISTANYSLESKSNSDASGEHCLEELDGQILISAASGEVSIRWYLNLILAQHWKSDPRQRLRAINGPYIIGMVTLRPSKAMALWFSRNLSLLMPSSASCCQLLGPPTICRVGIPVTAR
jgi:hypothetical protein